MATHETGGYDGNEHHQEDQDRLDTHDEDHGLEHEMTTRSEDHEESQVAGKEGKDEEDKEKKKVEVQDQTNLLPVRQIIFVFVGLTCAIFCSLLDQTM
jgi:CRISPR/Cas system CMR subunit Cmr4 (Cas7 group RAMP superfamily)